MFRVFILLAFVVSKSLGNYRIVFDEEYSPPKDRPKTIDMYYWVPLNEEISKPIIAYIVNSNGSRITDGPLLNVVVKVYTVDEYAAGDVTRLDTWKDSGGTLCKTSVVDQDYPRKLDRLKAITICGSPPDKTVLSVKAFSGRIILDGLFHKGSSVPQNLRVIRIVCNSPELTADTHPFMITTPAHHLVISKQPPDQVDANHAFSIKVSIMTKGGMPVDTGLDSVAYISVTVPIYYKTFHRTNDGKIKITHSRVRLVGTRDQVTGEEVIRKRAVNGQVTFNEVRILDNITDLKLNITMTTARYPWRRLPLCARCYDDTKHVTYNLTEVTYPDLGEEFYKKINATLLTNPFTVNGQTATSLKIEDRTLEKWKRWTDPKTNIIPIARNTPIPGDFSIYLSDKDDQAIYSGPDSDLLLKYSTEPVGVCVSIDATKRIRSGHANIYVSICQSSPKVKLIISIENKPNIKVETATFKVEEMLQIVHAGDFQNVLGLPIQSGINTYISTAIYENNNNKHRHPKLGLKFKLTTVDATHNIKDALKVFSDITEFANNPLTPIQGIVSSTTDAITLALNAWLTAMKIPYISTINAASYFSDDRFHFVNRVCWSENFILTAVLHIFVERHWMHIIILRAADIKFSFDFRMKMKTNNIRIEKDIIFEDTPGLNMEDSDSYFLDQMAQIASSRSRIILLFANNVLQTYILRAAYVNKLDTDHGYQWVILSQYIWQFPFRNIGACSKGPKSCREAFRGTLLIGETYDVAPTKKEWIRVLDRFFATDNNERQVGLVEYQSLALSTKAALGYDATLLLIYAISRLVYAKKSLSGPIVNKYLKNMCVLGLTGVLLLSEHGERLGYQGFIGQVSPRSHDIHYVRLLKADMLRALHQIPYESSLTNSSPIAQPILPISSKYNTIKYLSYTGIVSLSTQQMEKYPNEAWPAVEKLRSEKVIPSYICSRVCGSSPPDDSDLTVYDNGKCMFNGECKCNRGYAGDNCTIVSCSRCMNGKCISPEKCYCNPGWKGASCNEAHCESCVNGHCFLPDYCECLYYAMGKNCQIPVSDVAVSVIFGLLVLVFIIYLYARKVIANMRRTSALNSTEWIVNWSTVKYCQPGLDVESNTSPTKQSWTLLGSENLETYKWKKEKWYVQHIPNFTISRDDSDMRVEMGMLTKVKHPNLIRLGGACLTSPHVSLFTEVAPKGSLDDVLHIRSLDLGWQFRYSFMKDICSGMQFLHDETQIGSHGRLTSTNCLVDSHWSIKVSGFGAAIIRFGKYRQPKDKPLEVWRTLLWTSPELLRDANCLDDIKTGSKHGDVYSFAIIATEILFSEKPYEYELQTIPGDALLSLIKDPTHIDNSDTMSKWKEIGGLDMLAVRPILPEEHFDSKMMRRIVEEAWDKLPAHRPSFKKLHFMLEECHPASGGLMDNLINLLSSYSNNLEMIVMERTNEIGESKEKSEHLLHQLLPGNIADRLQMGEKVAPELFECVTVFFSDIVDFIDILIESTPFQIVKFLNDIYNAFDNAIKKYDVYTVETVADSYIVVSGLPTRIGNKHAGEIATMSLHLLSLVTDFKINHRPNATLQLRIGIHSGPVVAGIVGVMMPRYCLFGDTVNTASLIQSSSMSLQIQISDATAEILNELGGYYMVTRGMREIKGRGLMCTHWLNRKDRFNYILPDKSLAVYLVEHPSK